MNRVWKIRPGIACRLLLVSSVAYSLTLKMEVICSSRKSGCLRDTRRYNPKDRSIREMFPFATNSTTPLGPTQLHIALEVNRMQHKLTTHLPSSAQISNVWSYTSIPPDTFMGLCSAFEAFTAVTTKIVFFEVTTCNSVDRYHRFGGKCYLHRQDRRATLPYTCKKHILRGGGNHL
jgi:hypothetical protein